MSSLYFAYGSNMNPLRMQTRGLVFTDYCAGRLSGYRLLFNKRAADDGRHAYANIGFCAGAEVEGVLYRLSDPDEIVKMDPFEGTPRFYSRDLFPIATATGTVWAWVYVANPAMISADLRPASEYLQHLLAGRSLLSPAYAAWLEQTPCAAL